MVDSVKPGSVEQSKAPAGGEATSARADKPVANSPVATSVAIVPDAVSNAGPATPPVPATKIVAKKIVGRRTKQVVEAKPAAAPVVETPVVKAPVVTAPVVKAPVVKAIAPAKAPLPKRAVHKARPTPPAAKPVVTASKAPQPVKSAAAPLPRTATASRKEYRIMTATTTEYTEKFQTAIKDASEKAKAAFEKSQASFGEIGAFTKGNVEALVESSKILASGLQELTKGYAAESKSAFEALTAEFKSLAAVKSPSELLEKQSTLLRKQFDAAVAASSKNSEAVLKLVNEAFQPISTRVSLAVEKVKKAA